MNEPSDTKKESSSEKILILIMVLPFLLFFLLNKGPYGWMNPHAFSEKHASLNFAAKYFGIPSLIMILILIRKRVKDKNLNRKGIIGYIISIALCTGSLIFILSVIFTFANKAIGKQEIVLIEGNIISLREANGKKGPPILVVKNPKDEHTYTFKISYETYHQLKGKTHFRKQMKKGSLGFVYLE